MCIYINGSKYWNSCTDFQYGESLETLVAMWSKCCTSWIIWVSMIWSWSVRVLSIQTTDVKARCSPGQARESGTGSKEPHLPFATLLGFCSGSGSWCSFDTKNAGLFNAGLGQLFRVAKVKPWLGSHQTWVFSTREHFMQGFRESWRL